MCWPRLSRVRDDVQRALVPLARRAHSRRAPQPTELRLLRDVLDPKDVLNHDASMPPLGLADLSAVPCRVAQPAGPEQVGSASYYWREMYVPRSQAPERRHVSPDGTERSTRCKDRSGPANRLPRGAWQLVRGWNDYTRRSPDGRSGVRPLCARHRAAAASTSPRQRAAVTTNGRVTSAALVA